MAQEVFYYGQGRVFLAPFVIGKPPLFRFVGDVGELTVKLNVEKAQHNESYSGQKGLVVNFPTKRSCTMGATFFNIEPDNIALTLYGKVVSKAKGQVQGEKLPEGIKAGSVAMLEHFGVSAVTIKDSHSAPVTIDPKHYTVSQHGSITFHSLPDSPAPTQPLKVDYSYAAAKGVGLFTAPQPTVILRYEGINLAQSGDPVLLELYKVPTDPLQDFAFITDGNDVAGMKVEGGVLLDSSRPSSSEFGQFGRILQLSPEA